MGRYILRASCSSQHPQEVFGALAIIILVFACSRAETPSPADDATDAGSDSASPEAAALACEWDGRNARRDCTRNEDCVRLYVIRECRKQNCGCEQVAVNVSALEEYRSIEELAEGGCTSQGCPQDVACSDAGVCERRRPRLPFDAGE